MIIQGRTKEGIFARPILGVFVHPNGEEWSSKPYTAEQRKVDYEYRKEGRRIAQLIDGFGITSNAALTRELRRIENGTSTLPKRLRIYLIKRFKQ